MPPENLSSAAKGAWYLLVNGARRASAAANHRTLDGVRRASPPANQVRGG